MKPTHNLVIDVVALAAYLVAANPAITGLAVHEWISLGLIVVFIIHCAVHIDEILETVQRRKMNMSTANIVLDVVTLIVFMAVTVSGLLVSRHILPTFGLVSFGYFFWNPIHSIAAKLLLALLFVHVVLHWRWFTGLWKRKNPSDRQ
jgi:hypothetical protein